MMSDEDGPPEGDDLVELCDDAGVTVDQVLSLYELVHHHQTVVSLGMAMRELELEEDQTRRVFRLASLVFECQETGGNLFHLPDFAEMVAKANGADAFQVASFWQMGMGELREDIIKLFDGTFRGKELKFQLEESQRRWKDRMPGPVWATFMTLVVAETHFEESVSPARFTIKKARAQET